MYEAVKQQRKLKRFAHVEMRSPPLALISFYQSKLEKEAPLFTSSRSPVKCWFSFNLKGFNYEKAKRSKRIEETLLRCHLRCRHGAVNPPQ